jgi:crossover junction endodeoxyribonuclease RuvC
LKDIDYRVLGIDPGLANTGYAVISKVEGQLVLRNGGLIHTDSKIPLTQRLKEIYQELNLVINEQMPAIVAMEDLYSDYRNPGTAILMGHARGICLLSAANHGLEVISYSPARVKKSLTGNGRASKDQVKAMVRITLELDQELTSEHVADALAVALCHIRELGTDILRSSV